MAIDSTHLLTMLEPAVRPLSAPALRRTDAGVSAHAAPFREILALYSYDARPLPPRTRPLAVSGGAHLSAPLDADALARLGSAAEKAERAGALRAVMIYEGRGLVVDVAARTIEAELTSARSAPLTDIDGAAYVAAPGEETSEPSLRLPEAGVLPESIVKQIELAHALRAENGEEQGTTVKA
jgi:hypothetical protein